MNEVTTIEPTTTVPKAGKKGALAPVKTSAEVEFEYKQAFASLELRTRELELKNQSDANELAKAKREAEVSFWQDMSKVQGKLAPVRKDLDNSHTDSKYASYLALDRACRPAYAEAGLVLTFDTDEHPEKDKFYVTCAVANKMGHVHVYKIPMPIVTKGPKGNDVMTPIHATGSAVTYGRRYLLAMIFNLAFSDGTDDDGNAAGGISTTEKIGEDKAGYFTGLCLQYEAEPAKVLKTVGLESIADATESQFKKAIERLEHWAKKNGKKSDKK